MSKNFTQEYMEIVQQGENGCLEKKKSPHLYGGK